MVRHALGAAVMNPAGHMMASFAAEWSMMGQESRGRTCAFPAVGEYEKSVRMSKLLLREARFYRHDTDATVPQCPPIKQSTRTELTRIKITSSSSRMPPIQEVPHLQSRLQSLHHAIRVFKADAYD
jgi:hypothetical protein